jgi:sulfide:quinone oxidoreductase
VKRVVILGAGTAGTLMANRLRGRLSLGDWSITVVDRDDEHIYQPGLLLLPFGTYRPEELVRRRTPLLDAGIELRFAEIDRIDPDQKVVALTPSGPEQGADALRLTYDILIVATGCRIEPGATPGLAGAGWYERMFDFYTLEGATRLARALDDFQGGGLWSMSQTCRSNARWPRLSLPFLRTPSSKSAAYGRRSRSSSSRRWMGRLPSPGRQPCLVT